MKWPILLSVFLFALPGVVSGREFYVSASGNDRDPGTKAKPFATLEAARDAIRGLKLGKKVPPGGLTVWVRGGVYRLNKTFQLTAEDSGSEFAPIVYRACEGEEVRITGGREVTGFRRITDPAVLGRIDEPYRDKILQADLKAQGITDFGKLTPRGFGRPTTPSHMELFFGDKPMTLAGWPNGDWALIAAVPAGANGGKFTYEGDRPARWTKAEDIWLHGYWTWPWAESHEKVAKIDTRTSEIYTEPPHGCYGYQAQKRWRALNLLEELDTPGEYYVDRKSGVLYFWPPSPIGKSTAVVSITEQPLISLTDASQVTIRGLTIEACRGTAVVVTGGSDNLIAGCTLRNIGNIAVRVAGGFRNGVRSCDIHDLGDSGIVCEGGDRPKLIPGRNFVENCRIYRVSAWDKTYCPGIMLHGVGNRLANNEIFDLPHSAILFHGNDHIIEFNNMYGVCMETGDAGTVYTGRDFSWWGTVIRYNYIHDVGGYNDKHSSHGFSETMGVYLDDDTSGHRVYGNVFYKVPRAILVGGGRSNIVRNNIMIGCKLGLHLDARGMEWAKPTVDGLMKERLEAMPYRTSPWKDRYPELLTLYDDEPGVPKYNIVERNISLGGRWIQFIDSICEKVTTIEGNLVDVDPGFVDAGREDFRLRDDSPAFKLGFKRIPMERIGLQMDEYRRSIESGNGIPGLQSGRKQAEAGPSGTPVVRKLGTIACDLVEATPVVFKGRLYRFEYVRDQHYKPNLGKPSYFRFIDVAADEPTPAFAQGYHLGSAFVDGDTVYAFGVNIWDGEEIRVWWSKDLKTWQSKEALKLPGWGIFNTSVCKRENGRYVMAFEIGRPAEETGVPFTIRFAESKDCLNWKLTPSECVYSKDRYTACPAVRFLDGQYYMIYLEAYPGPTYNPCIVRSKDLIHWESSPRNPIMHYSTEDRFIANPKLTGEERDRIVKAVNINNSDIDLCEFQGRTVIIYSWGNQQGIEHLAQAEYDGTLAEFLKGWFPETRHP